MFLIAFLSDRGAPKRRGARENFPLPLSTGLRIGTNTSKTEKKTKRRPELVDIADGYRRKALILAGRRGVFHVQL